MRASISPRTAVTRIGADPPIRTGTCPEFISRQKGLPDYLVKYYWWAYLHPRSVRWLDRDFVVKTILWGWDRRLQNAACAEVERGGKVLQAACVYGSFSRLLAQAVGPGGELDIIDVAPIQVQAAKRKMAHLKQARVRVANAVTPDGGLHDLSCSFFLLHELPDTVKDSVVQALIGVTKPGGKVIFVDYHRPHWAHPLRPITSLVFDTLEPFAKGMWRREISDMAGDKRDTCAWTKETFFGGLFQKVVARKSREEFSRES